MNLVKINRFHKLNKNKLIANFKNTVQKNFNLQILDMTMRNIINYYCNDYTNKETIVKFQASFAENNVEKIWKIIISSKDF